MKRIVKFRVRESKTKAILGYERINKFGQWEFVRTGRGDNWLLGVITDGHIAQRQFREQFTGRKGKNGEEIYEGDLLATKFFPAYVQRISWKGPPDAICEVYWDFAGFGLKAQGKDDFRYPQMHELNYKHTEVVGSIYDKIKKK